MSDLQAARAQLTKVIDALTNVYRVANGLTAAAPPQFARSLLPDVDFQRLKAYRDWLDPAINAPIANAANQKIDVYDLLKSDFGAVHPTYGTIKFKALGKIAQPNPQYDPSDKRSREFQPFRLFTYPRDGDPFSYADYGATLSMDVAAFSLGYDFRNSDYDLISLNEIDLILEARTRNATTGALETLFTTPSFPVTVEIRIPKPYGVTVAFPEIEINFFGFGFDLDINFPSMNLDWSPLSFRFPDWLDWPFGSLDFGDLFGSSLNCNCLPAFAGPGWFKGWPGIDLSAIKVFFQRLGALLDFGSGSIDWMTHAQKAPTGGLKPEWVAIYFNLTNLSSSILGGFSPKQLHLMLGIHADRQIRAGVLITSDVLGLVDRALMMQAAVYYQFDTESADGSSSDETTLTARPGLTLEVLSGAKHLELAQKAGAVPPAPSTVPPPEAKIDFGNALSIKADRVDLAWDADAAAYVFSIDGKVTLKQLLRDSETSADLELPFKKLGVTTDGRFVLGDSWVTPPKTPQITIDDFPQVAFLLRHYGYGKQATGDFWIGFSGDIRLKELGLEASVDRLVFRSSGDVELSGVRVDLSVANVLKLKGSVAWGSALANVPTVAGTSVSGFGGQLALGIDAIPLGLGLGMTYVRIEVPPDDYVAWSFYLQVPLPVVIPICYCLGLSSVGLLVGQNYLPKPKQQGLPTAEWLEKGLNGDVENLLDVPRTWTVEDGAFAAGFDVGIASTADNGYIINAKAIMVLVVPGPLVMIAGKANILSRANPAKSGAIDLLIVYDQADPGILASLAFAYKIKYLASVSGMAELYFSFTDAGDWHFYLGTPSKRIGGSILGIFEAQAYLTLDPTRLAVGAMVFYGKRWVFGPLTVKCYVSFSADVTIGWNPVFVLAKVRLAGEIGATVFGFGLEAGLSAQLEVRAPDPWYLMAQAEARFRISLFFFSWSFTATLEFSWGEPDNPPDVELDILSTKEKRLELTSSASQSHASLITDNPGSLTGKIPMDGVFGLRFLRDIEIDSTGTHFPKLEGTTPVSIKDEKSPNAGNLTRFHGKLTGFEVRKKSGSSYQPVSRSFHFDWTPLDTTERRKLAVRQFDQGYSQFRLNDDPNAHVRLTCPSFYASSSMLDFGIDQSAWEERSGRFALQSPVTLLAQPSAVIELRLTTTPATDPADVTMDYSDATVDLVAQPVVVVDRSGASNVLVRSGFTIEFSTPAAAIGLSFRADSPTAGARVSDLVTLLDDHDVDMTTDCINHVAALPGGGLALMLNDVDPTPVTSGKEFSTQRPPRRGVKRLVIKRAGALRHVHWRTSPVCLVTMTPQGAIEEIYRRNSERLEQQAQLAYVFGQNGDPGKLLWEPGEYRVTGTTVWGTDAGDLAPTVDTTSGPSQITHAFTVVRPFEPTSVTVNGASVATQPYEGYLRRGVPANGQRPFYRTEYPVVAYRVNYVNAMLRLGDSRLAMVLRDANGDLLTHTRWWVEILEIGRVLHADLAYLARRADAVSVGDASELVDRIGDLAPGVDPEELVAALEDAGFLGATAERTGRDEPDSGGPLRIRTMSRAELLAEATGLARRRARWGDDPRRDSAIALRKLVDTTFADVAARGGLVLERGDSVGLVRLRTATQVAEYRYTNDDLALELSSLDLSDCLGTTPTKLNAYERGYFAPVIPPGATFDGPTPLTAYTAELYCLGESADLAQHLGTAGPLSTTPFTTSAFHGPDELADLFPVCKVRDAILTSVSFGDVVADLDSGTATPPFAHPGNSTITLHVGADIFRDLHAAQAVSAGGKTPHQVEEEYHQLYDDARSAIDDRRAAESLLLDDIAATMGVALEPTSRRRIVATWLRGGGSTGATPETYGVLLEFPEPIDWDRTAISLDTFTIDLDGQTRDVLQLEAADPRYNVDLHWIRSKDGTRLLLLPVIELTTVTSPRLADVELGPSGARGGPGDLEGRAIDTAGTPNGEVAEDVSDRRPFDATVRSVHRLSDVVVASTTGPIDRGTYRRYAGRYGTVVTSRITRFEPDDLQLDVYFVSDNHEGADDRYRAVPRLRFRNGPPGDTNGYLGTLIPLTKEAS